MKKIIALTGIMALSITLGACNPRNDIKEDKMPQDNSPTESNIPPRTGDQLDDDLIDDTTDIENEVKEDIKDLGDNDNDTTVTEGEKGVDTVDNAVMTDEEMIENSNYIAKVKMIQKDQSTFELKVLENLKGSLSGKEIPNSENLNQNRAYLVFLKDVDGNLVPTNGKDSYVLLEGDNHVLFEKINKNR